jgi:hypothetical protein
VWIEWREASKGLDGSDEAWETMIRMATLAQTLAAPKPRQFLTPTCIGYVDDRAAHSRLAWIFAMPEGSSCSTALRTLHSLLGRIQHQRSLSQRIALAHRLASSVLYLHTMGWLHKAGHSANPPSHIKFPPYAPPPLDHSNGSGALDIADRIDYDSCRSCTRRLKTTYCRSYR